MKVNEMGEGTTLREQLQSAGGPVILINKFTVAEAESGALLAAWTEDAAYMRAQPGFISTQLYRGIGGSGVFVNYAVWESVEAFTRAFTQPAFQASLAKYPPAAECEPHLFRKEAVPGICVGA